jgi:hypothetical protein
MRRGAGVLTVSALLACGTAAASTGVAVGVQRPALKVDARGNAEISWTQDGARRTLLFPPTGRVLPGGTLAGRDVSRATTAPMIPFKRVLRRRRTVACGRCRSGRRRPAGASSGSLAGAAHR